MDTLLADREQVTRHPGYYAVSASPFLLVGIVTGWLVARRGTLPGAIAHGFVG